MLRHSSYITRHQQPVADDDLEAFPYAIAQTPKALPLLANTDINTTHPVAFAPVHSISDDDDLPVLDATVPTSTMSSSALTVPSSDGPSSRHNLPDRIRASRPDLTDLWMSSLDLVKANPLKGGDLDLKVVTIQGKKVVVRVLANAADASSTTSHAFFDSIQFIRRIMHPHITSVLGVGCLQHHEDVAVATEFMDQGSLGAYLLQLKKQPSSTAATLRGPLHLALHIGRALDYLHTTHNLAFGSIHPDKVLVYRDSTADDDNPRVGAKLSVFHLMARGPHGAVYEPKRACSNTSGLANNVAFLAPERRTYTDNEPTMASDVYALAVVAAMIWTTEAPHSALYHEQGLVRGDVFLYNHSDTFPYSSLPGMPTPLADLLRQCWQVHPASRPSVATLVAALEQFAQ
ncbi:hypothetical protein DYB32_007388 [Aphanomyces invadans]|uniref:Protein kinase domain-containing protein n=1 Tax=Aphanomyces invadans TaxID=157072 RepID=A0A3R6WKM7_9STRA|nr:hypothetical protein DYB32_007388 [Aphanomyces invadans]